MRMSSIVIIQPLESQYGAGNAVIIIHWELKVNSFYPLARLFSALTGVKFYFLNQFLNEPLLDFRGWLVPLSPPFCLGVYWIDHHLQIFSAMIFLLSVSSLHICFLSQMVVVLILFTSQPYGTATHPVGKSYASIVDDEKTAFLGGVKIKTRYHHHSCFCRYGRVAGIMEKTTCFSKAIYL